MYVIQSLTVGCMEKVEYDKDSQVGHIYLHYKGNQFLFECVSFDVLLY